MYMILLNQLKGTHNFVSRNSKCSQSPFGSENLALVYRMAGVIVKLCCMHDILAEIKVKAWSNISWSRLVDILVLLHVE